MIRALIQGSAAEHPLGVGGVTLVGMNRETLIKLLATLALIIASATFEILSLPPLRISRAGVSAAS